MLLKWLPEDGVDCLEKLIKINHFLPFRRNSGVKIWVDGA